MKLSLTLDWREWSAPEKIQNAVVPAGHCPPPPPPPGQDNIVMVLTSAVKPSRKAVPRYLVAVTGLRRNYRVYYLLFISFIYFHTTKCNILRYTLLHCLRLNSLTQWSCHIGITVFQEGPVFIHIQNTLQIK